MEFLVERSKKMQGISKLFLQDETQEISNKAFCYTSSIFPLAGTPNLVAAFHIKDLPKTASSQGDWNQ